MDRSPSSFDLHVLSTPPAFVLSQDQTLHQRIWCEPGKARTVIQVCHGRLTKGPTTCSFQLTGIKSTDSKAAWLVVMLRTRLRSSSLPFSRSHQQTAHKHHKAKRTSPSNVRRCGEQAYPAALSEEPIADRECGEPRRMRDPRAGRMTNLYAIHPAGNPPFTKSRPHHVRRWSRKRS